MSTPRMTWHKVDSLSWLDGSIRTDLTLAERSIWADILALAALSRRRGYLERGKGVPWSRQHLAERFDVPLSLLNLTVRKCLKEGRLKLDSKTLYVTNWELYQASRDSAPAGSKEARLKVRARMHRDARMFPKEATEVLSELAKPIMVSEETGEILNPEALDKDTGV